MTRPERRGYTVLELMVVLALLVILGAAIIPSIAGISGNVRQKAGADLVRARLADARAKAMEDARAYRVALTDDGTRIRVAPDGLDYATTPPDDPPSYQSKVTEDPIDKASAHILVDSEDAVPERDAAGWSTVATFLPDGTCREANVTVEVREKTFPPIRIQIRGVTGSTRLLPVDPNTHARGPATDNKPGVVP
jgi:prepilin-type N-terminal cleavage/methylation domain-containing protein